MISPFLSHNALQAEMLASTMAEAAVATTSNFHVQWREQVEIPLSFDTSCPITLNSSCPSWKDTRRAVLSEVTIFE